MANNDAPFGLRPINSDGSVTTGNIKPYYVPATDSTAIFLGDPVTIVGDSNDNEFKGFPAGTLSEVTRSTVGDGNAITGVVVGVQYDSRDSLKYRAASTERLLYVCDDPTQLFEIQADGTLTADSIGLNAVLIATHSGDTIYGYSGIELNTTSDAPDADASNQLTIEGLKPAVDNELASANSIAIVRINNHTRAHGAIGVA